MNEVFEEREFSGCNKMSCNYEFQPIDVLTDENGMQKIKRAIFFCKYCCHLNEMIFAPTQEEIEKDKMQENL